MPLDIYLVRHGETQSNLDRVFQGHLDTLLTDRGREQACAVGEWLAGVRFDAIYASDLARAADTARAIASARGSNEIIFDRDLREMNYGVLQGVAIADFGSVLAAHGLAQQWGAGPFSERGIAPPGGESRRQLRNRVSRFLARLGSEHTDEDERAVLVVTHGGVLRMMMTVLLGMPARSARAFAFDNCSVTRVVRDGGGARIEYHNYVCWNGSAIRSTVPGE